MKNNNLLKSLQLKNYTAIVLFLLTLTTGLQAQTAFTPGGAWDAGWSSSSAGTVVHNNGVVQLVSIASVSGPEGASVQETNNLIVTGASWSRCYNVFFGCPGNDNIGSDQQGDGMAWSIYDPTLSGCAVTVGTGGGGLGYNSTGCARMLTIEFDTYSSAFDGTYGGGTSGNNDEIAVHVNGNADGTTANKLTAVNAGNLEDGLEHAVCISYTPSGTYPSFNGTLVVTIDGVTKLSYALGATYNLESYFDPHPVSGSSAGPPYSNNNVFDAGSLAQMWSAGKQNATDPATVTPDAATHIIPNLLSGTTLCPASVTISAGPIGCSGSYLLSSTVNPPSGNTVTKVEFYDGATLVGTDLTAAYSTTITPSAGSHDFTAKAYFSGGGTMTSSIQTVNVGGATTTMQVTSTPIVVTPGTGGSVDATWSSYPSFAANHRQSGSTPINDANLGASFKAIYDNNYLYILVDVTDNISDFNNTTNAWDNDAVELFIDIGKDAGTSYGANDQHYMFSRSGIFAQEDHSHSLTNITYGVIEKGAGLGYYLEAKLSWATMGGPVPPVAGSALGFDIAAGDADGGARTNIVTWYDGAFDAYANANHMGTLNFSGCDPLPVELMSFTAVKKNGTVVLDWATALEKNNNRFVIERSNDGLNWTSIGEVMGMGNTNSIRNYSFTDTDPLDGISYYRLRQIDNNGNSSLSKIAVVQTSHQLASISPNPFDNQLTIKTNIKGDLDISIHDVLGRLLYETNKEVEDGLLTIHPELASGAYIVTISANEFIEHYRVIKK
jgi:hypothetical protein